jgi:hypothetical protein
VIIKIVISAKNIVSILSFSIGVEEHKPNKYIQEVSIKNGNMTNAKIVYPFLFQEKMPLEKIM